MAVKVEASGLDCLWRHVRHTDSLIGTRIVNCHLFARRFKAKPAPLIQRAAEVVITADQVLVTVQPADPFR